MRARPSFGAIASLVLFFVALAILMAQGVIADPSPPINLQVYSSSSRQLPVESNSNISAVGGNITEVNIDALTVTKSWQGYYGNISGNIHLDDANNNSFYLWGNASSLSGQIFAARNSTIQWASVNCSSGAQRTAEDAYLGLSWANGDSVTNTFNTSSHPSFLIGLNTIANNSCFSTNLLVNGTAQNTSFFQVLLSDNSSNMVYSTLIENKKHAYNGQLADFQLLVGENEHAGNLGPTTYYFFVEIN